MNLDELKSVWNSENTDDVNVPKTVQSLKKAQHPLDKLKRNMKNEWFMQLVAIFILGFIPQLQNINVSLYPFYYVSYGFLIIVSMYYLNSFRNFYTQVVHYSGDTKASLTEIYYGFRLNIERYHSFGFLLLPFTLVWIGVYIQNSLLKKGENLMLLSDNKKALLVAAVVVITFSFIIAIFGWTRYYYGTYLKKLKIILDELKSD